MRSWVKRGFKACFLVSGSVDGEVPERIAKAWGAEVIRGSANQSGALALRDMQTMMKNGHSIVTTADGPAWAQVRIQDRRDPDGTNRRRTDYSGRLCGRKAPGILNRWDNFMIPKPFSRISLAIGEPYPIPRSTPLDELEPHRQAVQERVMSLMADCESQLGSV